MNADCRFLLLGMVAALIGGCTTVTRDAEGFVPFDGATMSSEPPGEYFILRFERPVGVYTNGWKKGLTRWVFTEVRQLKEGVSKLEDGELKTPGRAYRPCNWAKWIGPGSRNVRVKFVNADYKLAQEGKKEAPDGFVPMFNGVDFTGWEGVMPEEDVKGPNYRHDMPPEKLKVKIGQANESMRAHWSYRDGAIFFDGGRGGTSIATKKLYRNFEMLVDWRLLRVYGDSGFYLRAMSQVQIWDPNTWAGMGSGGLWNNERTFFGATTREDRPIGDWNTFRLRFVGDCVSVWLNGVKVVDSIPMENCWDYDAPIPFRDNIQLQCHGDPIEFRNLFIRELPETEAQDR